ncbi:MAG TPA: type II secretion system minor pseudopilin GspJ [Nevskiaceae bacterium]|nr:type II secretion system minor pseudopilin GspJ [Nevskiaceae bacterium]
MKRQPGFTLLELVVAIGIFALVALMAYGGLNSVLKGRRQVEESLDRTGEFQRAYRWLRDDFQQVRTRPARDAYGDAQPALRGDHDTRVEFTRGGWRNPAELPRPGLERVDYILQDKKLMRESFRVLDQGQDSKAVQSELLDQVEDMSLRYLSASREWSDTWPPPDNTGGAQQKTSPPPPMAVEMSLRTKDWGDLRFLFRIGLDTPPQGYTPGAASGAPTTTPTTTVTSTTTPKGQQ